MAKKAKRRTTRGGGGGLKLALKLDPEKVKRIQQCLKKGTLTITVSRVSALGRAENGYLYD
jgi:hypothetical protein